MADFTGFLPLAQLNASAGGSGTSTNSGSAAATAAAPAAVDAAKTVTTALGTTTAESNPATGSRPAAADGGIMGSIMGFLPIIVMIGLLYLFLFRGQQKESKRRKALIAELKKGDRVMTIGGMVAKVVSVDGDEVVLKIDEAANVKATYRKTAIQEVIVDKEEKK